MKKRFMCLQQPRSFICKRNVLFLAGTFQAFDGQGVGKWGGTCSVSLTVLHLPMKGR